MATNSRLLFQHLGYVKRTFVFIYCLALSFASIALVGHASAATPQAVVGMPFSGQWAYNVLVSPPYTSSNSSHPCCHWTPGGGNWATDVYAADSSNYACYADNGQPGTTLNYGAHLGVLGSSNTGAQQACSSIPSASSWGGVGSATYTGGDSMASGTTMLPNYYLTSLNVQHALVFQTDSNLVLYSGNGTVLWQSGTSGQNANRLVMQSDGNLVMYTAPPANVVVWQSGTGGHTGAYANLQSDGNFVVRDASTVYSQTFSGGHPNLSYYGSDRLTSSSSPLIEQYLNQNQYLRSSDNRYALLLQTDGNVVLYGPGYHVLWSTYTNSGDTFKMQSDGNLVLYAIGTAKWQSLTSGNPGAYYAIMQTDGNFVVYNSSNFPLWPSGTGGQI